MTNEQIKYSLETGEMKLGSLENLTHFGIVGYLSIFPATLSFHYIKDLFVETPEPLKDGEIWFIVIPTFLGILFYRLQKNRLKFRIINTDLTREELNTIIKKLAKDLAWEIYLLNKKIIIAKTHPGFFSTSWGEQITILFDRDRILVNSICDPDKRSSIVSLGRNKKNINRLIEEIEKVSR